MCKERIEKTLTAVEGVQSASWDVDTETASIAFDPALTDQNKLEMAVARVGHSTENHKSPRSVHDALPDCCQEGAEKH